MFPNRSFKIHFGMSEALNIGLLLLMSSWFVDLNIHLINLSHVMNQTHLQFALPFKVITLPWFIHIQFLHIVPWKSLLPVGTANLSIRYSRHNAYTPENFYRPTKNLVISLKIREKINFQVKGNVVVITLI